MKKHWIRLVEKVTAKPKLGAALIVVLAGCATFWFLAYAFK